MEYGKANCPRCREEINPEYALMSAVLVHHNTQAISVANTISSFDAFIPIALILSVCIHWFNWLGGSMSWMVLWWPLMPLLAIVVWYFRYGRFVAGDEEFIKARQEMRKSFCFWLVFLVVQAFCMPVFWRMRS
jgi:hypothetical protein